MSRRRPSRFDGLLPVSKEIGPTSHDVVDMARKGLKERRIGHTGTLDPAAEGLLLLCVGQATRLQKYLLGWEKTYRGLVRLGHATATYDSEGEAIDPRGTPPALDRAALDEIERAFSGTITQVPPPFSAKKVGGKRLYELARSGEVVEVEPKQVSVSRLVCGVEAPDLLTIELSVSSGFYVRSLAHDIGLMLGCGAYLHHLRRLKIGPYDASSALPQGALEGAESPEEIVGGGAWIKLDEVALPFPEIGLNLGAAERFRHGQEVIVFRSSGDPLAVSSSVAVRDPAGRLLGVGMVQHVLARGRTVAVRPATVLSEHPPRPHGR